ncbi:MAG TPA: carboxypeptidase-like regulatory domain-containing protein [Vicinamibacterales bacterium]|nr:carboxypeptidase-like regulatory domain-containing protein [Vicinamibacterales bacterium]
MRRLQVWLGAVLLLVLVPAMAFAQASITGTVKDASGAILPGVTVEASSPALIEKTRTAVTDGTGQYRIVDLRAGTYTVTFTLTGFSSVKREGIELSGQFTATVNADMKVGAVEETITVTGETPIVDTQSVRRQVTVSNDVITSMPAARSYAGVMLLIPATTTQAGGNLDIQITPGMLVFGGAGGRTNEARIQVDGLNTGAAFNGAGVSSYVPDIGNAQEIAMTTSGGLGEAEVGGPSFSIVPKTGGNTFKGSGYISGVSSGMVGNNYTAALKAQGLTTPGALTKLWDYNGGLGGPIKKDRVWFFMQYRDEGSYRTVPGMFANVNMGDITKWTYAADLSRPAVQAGSWRTGSIRLTVQPTTRNKFNLFWDEQHPCQGAGWPGTSAGCRQSSSNEIICGAPGSSNPSCSATAAPEVGTYLNPYGQRVQQFTWSSPVTNKLLLEAGVGTYLSRWGGNEMPGFPQQDNFIQAVENCARGCANNGNIPGLTYRSGTWRADWQGTHSWRASASYVTGAQNMKFGYQGGYLVDNEVTYGDNQELIYRMQNGTPDQLTETIDRWPLKQRVRYDAYYAQDSWTRGRMTLQGAVRYDRAWSWFPEVQVGGVPFLPQTVTYPETQGVTGYNDITPRGGVAIDVFGNGKTSIKVNAGKYLQAAQNGLTYGALRPTSRLTTTVTRTWTDANHDYAVDCNLANPLANAGIDSCGQISDLAFGQNKFTSDLAPDLVSGWGVRSGDWQFGASVQQELMPRVSVEAGYNRRWLTNFTVTDNLLQAPGNFGTFSIAAPTDPRLGAASGQTIGGLYNVNQNVASSVSNLQELAPGAYSQMYNGLLVNLTARPRNGLVFQGGVSSGTTRTDYCSVRTLLPEQVTPGPPTPTGFSPTNPWCNTATGWVTRYSGLGSYTLPKVDVQIAGTFRSDQGAPLAANYNVPNSAIAPSLGRNLSNGAPFASVNLIEPGTLYGDRVNEFDLRFAKILKFGRTRTNVGIDIYNILNSAAVLTYNQTYSPLTTTWLTPTSVLQPRFLKISAQIDF